MKRRRRCWLTAAVCLLAVLALGACEAPQVKTKTPALLLYLQGQRLADQELYGEAIAKFQEVADTNPGTLLGSFAYLRIAEVRMAQQDWDKAETNYRLFLTGNQSSHLTPYVLYKLAQTNHEQSFTGVFFPAREVDRDQQPNRETIQEYKRFFFLYPGSIYLPEMRVFANDARITLAEYERRVGDFYYNREHYHAAASRYLYLLRSYPDYKESDQVLRRLIQAYRRDQQPALADELERLTAFRKDGGPAAAPAAPGAAADEAAGGTAQR